MRLLLIALSASLLLTPSVVLAHRLIEAKEAVTVARSELTVIPTIDWNRISQRPGSRAERWTLDGELLNDVLFFGEIEDGDTLFREVDRRNSPLPEFSETMLLVDVPTFYEGSVRIAKGAATFEVSTVEPITFLGQPGVRFEFTTIGADDIRRDGLAVATIIENELYLMSYEAPSLYFYERDLAHFERLVESARMD